jgi:hypothetical protein
LLPESRIAGPVEEGEMHVPFTQLLGRNGDKDFQARMVEYIREHFADLLGQDMGLLDVPGGLEILSKKLQSNLRPVMSGAKS